MSEDCGVSRGRDTGTDHLFRGSPSMSETAKWIQELAEPRPGGEKVYVAIERAAKLAGLTYWRAREIWYSKARQIETFEIDQIADAIKLKNEKEARDELRNLKARLQRLESRFAAGDKDFYSPSIDHARELVRQLSGPYRPLAGR